MTPVFVHIGGSSLSSLRVWVVSEERRSILIKPSKQSILEPVTFVLSLLYTVATSLSTVLYYYRGLKIVKIPVHDVILIRPNQNRLGVSRDSFVIIDIGSRPWYEGRGISLLSLPTPKKGPVSLGSRVWGFETGVTHVEVPDSGSCLQFRPTVIPHPNPPGLRLYVLLM